MEINALKIVEELLLNFADFADNMVGALAVVLIGWLVARLVARFVQKVLKAIGIDKLAERLNEIEVIHKSKLRIVPSILLSKILYYVLFFIFIIAATDVLGMEAVTLLMGDLLGYIPKLLSALLVLVVGILVCDFLKKWCLRLANPLVFLPLRPSPILYSTFCF